MKTVTRYQCEYCGKLYIRPVNAERHERECYENPAGVNCFRCKHASPLGMAKGNTMTDEYNVVSFDTYCNYYEKELAELKRPGFMTGNHRSLAPECDMFELGGATVLKIRSEDTA